MDSTSLRLLSPDSSVGEAAAATRLSSCLWGCEISVTQRTRDVSSGITHRRDDVISAQLHWLMYNSPLISYTHFTFFSVTLYWTHRVQLQNGVLFGFFFFFPLSFNCCFSFSSVIMYGPGVVKLYVTTFEMCNLSRMISWCTIFLCMTVKNCRPSCWQTEYQTQLSPLCLKEFKKVIDTLDLYLPKKEIMTFSKKIRI